ncbi:MAG: hypothetical protein LBV09_02770 [Deferribacteraceae bacterium]|nr:hypothetical protein [Deferribacteraceae bacterium]
MVINPTLSITYSGIYKAQQRATAPVSASSKVDRVEISAEAQRAIKIDKFLSDKPFTKVQYTRLLEQSPEKADLFITANMEYDGVYSGWRDEKLAGKSYEEVLAHVNKLLEEDRQAVTNFMDNKAPLSVVARLSSFNYIFQQDDRYGVTHRGVRPIGNGRGNEYLPLDSDKWLSEDEFQKAYPPEYGEFSGYAEATVCKPVGQGETGAYNYKLFKLEIVTPETERWYTMDMTPATDEERIRIADSFRFNSDLKF